MKLGKIYNYKNAEEAKKLIGKKVIATDFFCRLENPKDNTFIGIFRGLSNEKMYPFNVALPSVGFGPYQFIREVIEEEEDEPILMTNRQLAEWIGKKFGEVTSKVYAYVNTFWIYEKGEENTSVNEDILIRYYRSNKWIKPTKALYIKDCKMKSKIS